MRNSKLTLGSAYKPNANIRTSFKIEEWESRLSELQGKRSQLIKTIKHMERRLIGCHSDPLSEACHELKKKDLALLCKITDILVENIK